MEGRGSAGGFPAAVKEIPVAGAGDGGRTAPGGTGGAVRPITGERGRLSMLSGVRSGGIKGFGGGE